MERFTPPGRRTAYALEVHPSFEENTVMIKLDVVRIEVSARSRLQRRLGVQNGSKAIINPYIQVLVYVERGAR